jgi:hypothetical protein
MRRFLSTLSAVSFLYLAVATTGPLLMLNNLLSRYDRMSYRSGHAPLIRRFLPRRPATYLGPLLPLCAVGVLELCEAIRRTDIAPAAYDAICVASVIIGLALAEVYAVCIRRETFIAAFEPWLLPPGYAPLGAKPARVADRRLQHIARIQYVYCVPLVATGMLVEIYDAVPAWLTASAFFAKYLLLASLDFEAYFHWDIHCRVLDLPARPRLAATWRAAADWLTGPMIGALPHFYRTEHLVVHHPENAGPDDIHSPLPYDRTRTIEFCVFGLHTCISMLTGYAVLTHRRCRGRSRIRLSGAIIAYWLAVAALTAPGRLLGYWLIAAVLHRAINAALAQYLWHGLCNQANPRNPKASTILWLPTDHLTGGNDPGAADDVPDLGTDWAFYDNYHLIHHLHPRAHFTDYPALLRKEIPELLATGCVVLSLARYDHFIADCWTGDLDAIATALVTPIPTPQHRQFLQSRLAAMPSHRSPAARASQGRLGTAANKVLTWCYVHTAG